MAGTMGSSYLTQQITRMEASVEQDPELAIGTAKELVETVCKTILEERGEDPKGEMPVLVKRTRKALSLLPDDVSDKAKGKEAVNRTFNGLSLVIQSIIELRNLYGAGHGRSAKSHKGIQPRHARLATGAAATLASFLFETHMVRPNKSETKLE